MDALRFAEVARSLAGAARSLNLEPVPAFRSPPRKAGETRTLRRYETSVVVSVLIRDRDDAAVVLDMVDGTLAAARVGDRTTRELLLEAALHACEHGDAEVAPSRASLGLAPRPEPKPKPERVAAEPEPF